MAQEQEQFQEGDAQVEARLLLYLAGEIPADERAALEARLSIDPALHARLERLSAGWSGAQSLLVGMDERDHPLATEAASHKVARQIRQWQARRLAESVPKESAPTRRLGRSGLAIAAGLMVALGLAWWVARLPRPPAPEPVQLVQEENPPRPDSALEPMRTDEIWANALYWSFEDVSAEIESAEEQLLALEYLSDSAAF